MNRTCLRILAALLPLLGAAGTSDARGAPIGPAAAAIDAWIAKGSYLGCYVRKACGRNSSLPIDVRYTPGGDQALAFVPWEASNGAAGLSVGIFREDNDRWSFVGNSDDLPSGIVWRIMFVGREVTFITCTATTTGPDTCKGRIVSSVDLGR